jgi:Zn-dependent protease
MQSELIPLFLTIQILILLFSIILHEVMHGYIALRFGDHTAERAGRLTFNPIPHIDPIGSILLPALLIFLPMVTGTGTGFFIAWAKPVPINPLNFSNIKLGELWVSAAGIIANISLAILGTILFHLFAPTLELGNILIPLLSFTVTINLVLGIFNLFPIFPLDGSKILLALLPYKLAREYEKLAPYGFIVLLALLWMTPIFGMIIGTALVTYSELLNIPLRFF